MLIDDGDMIQAKNHSTRIPVVLCLDTSRSMVENGGFDALNVGVRAFFGACKADPINRYGFDVAVVTFGAEGVKKVQGFMPIWDVDEAPTFKFTAVRGETWIDGTPLAGGIDKAIDELQYRKEEYKKHSIGYYQPFVVVITDGLSTEKKPDKLAYFLDIQEKTVALQREKKLQVIAIGVGDQDYADLANFVIDKKILLAKDFQSFDLVFEFMSSSMSSASNAAFGEEAKESPLSQIMKDLEDEECDGISIEDFSLDID